jgi:hypothetical protein
LGALSLPSSQIPNWNAAKYFVDLFESNMISQFISQLFLYIVEFQGSRTQVLSPLRFTHKGFLSTLVLTGLPWEEGRSLK